MSLREQEESTTILERILKHELMVLDRELNSLEKIGPKGWKEYWRWRRHRKRIVQETLERYSDVQQGKKLLENVLQEISNQAKWLKETEK